MLSHLGHYWGKKDQPPRLLIKAQELVSEQELLGADSACEGRATFVGSAHQGQA